ncbi:hypothetical protein [Spirosoma linguale]
MIAKQSLLFVGLGFAALLSACSPAPTPVPITEQPGQGVTPPGSGTVTPPGNSTTTPGNDVGISLGTTRLSWSAFDVQEWTHDAAGQWVRYLSQWNSVQGTSTVSRLLYDFQYVADGQLQRLTVSDATRPIRYVEYRYANGLPLEAKEYTVAGNLMGTYQFQITQGRLLEQTESHVLPVTRQVRKRFSYDSKGNLADIQEWTKPAGEADFTFSSRILFSQYDNQPATVEQALLSYPYLPGVRFQTNNPGSRRMLNASGQELSEHTQTYRYTFGADGRVVSKTVSGAGGTYSGQFQHGPRW